MTNNITSNTAIIFRLSVHFFFTVLLMQIPLFMHSNAFLLSISLWNSYLLSLQKDNTSAQKAIQQIRRLNLTCMTLFSVVIIFTSQRLHLQSMFFITPALLILSLYLDQRWNH